MREIKFRVRVGDMWHYWGFIPLRTGMCFTALPSSNMEALSMEELQARSQQFTGLHDKSGVEIYEGDIVQFTYWWFNGSEQETQLTGVIGFDNASFTLEQIDNDFFEHHTGYKKGDGKLWFGELNFDNADFSVIGSLVENPELLEAK